MRILCRSDLAALALVVLALGACKPGQERAAPLPPVGDAKLALEKAACVKRGGQWAGEAGAQFCLERLKDGGKACRSGADCEGACLARSQTCAPVRPLLGCNEIITGAGLRVSECVN